MFQEIKFQKLIDHAKNNVPYFKEKLENINGLRDIHKIDFFTKEIIRKYNSDTGRVFMIRIIELLKDRNNFSFL